MWNISMSVIFAGLAGCMMVAAPTSDRVFSDFESITSNTQIGEEFTIGDPPNIARFSGDGFAGRMVIPELYFDGFRAWMIQLGGAGDIRFDAPVKALEFYGRTHSMADGPMVITVFDASDLVLGSTTLDVGDPFALVSFSGGIARIEVVNNATGSDHFGSIDNFGFTLA
jgi:hypothetical protein